MPDEGVARTDSSAVERLIRLCTGTTWTVALTGAGISTESGIPDYRGPNGVWATGQIPTISDFLTNSTTRRAYWEGRRTRYPEMAAKAPNRGHDALVALQRIGRLQTIITQNIDGLHQKAGSPEASVIELHGSSHRIKCLSCGRVWPAAEIQDRLTDANPEPRCEDCGGVMRAATILFGESLPHDALQAATQAVLRCELLLVIGSSLVVNPAAQLPGLAKRQGARLGIINRTPTGLDDLADVVVHAEAGPTLSALCEALREQAVG